jgi:DNA-binding response OmpR family regulator
VARVLLVHHDPGARQVFEAMLNSRHEVAWARDYAVGIKAIRTRRPALILASLEGRNGDALLLLRYLKDNGIRIPVIAIAGRGAGLYQHAAMKLGAKAFLEYPVDEPRLTESIDAALSASVAGEAPIPPVTADEANANLTELEKRLNRQMKCFAGKNLVYLQSYIGLGTRVHPRICLKCPLRKEYGLEPNMYYEYIRDVCCTDPKQCEAVQIFESRQDR